MKTTSVVHLAERARRILSRDITVTLLGAIPQWGFRRSGP